MGFSKLEAIPMLEASLSFACVDEKSQFEVATLKAFDGHASSFFWIIWVGGVGVVAMGLAMGLGCAIGGIGVGVGAMGLAMGLGCAIGGVGVGVGAMRLAFGLGCAIGGVGVGGMGLALGFGCAIGGVGVGEGLGLGLEEWGWLWVLVVQ
ncbi:keratin, type II cytoskeletal I-like [Impatiens glandulifera]|uniref:keratin, type II cytoskeletal I-like n=1 Tax=Impatiens glandulifera TaxID=253017 RepID=UPI001FB106DD|nr:keratin, type II cytoskeletal I-like [Impatiens glandulifera]